MVTTNPGLAGDSLLIDTISRDSRLVRVLDAAVDRPQALPLGTSWFDHRTTFREPEWFELRDEFE